MKKLFFIGVGGKGLNGIAKICLEKGHQVSGVDRVCSPETEELAKNGAKIFYKHNRENLDPETDLVIYSSIINHDCPEIIRAKELGIKLLKRSQFLDKLTSDNFRISVSGSHGKSTTTALVGLGLINAGIDTTIFGGAYSKELRGYNHMGKSKYAVLEACEYDRSFHDLIGDISIITSIEKSHLEYYKDEEEMVDSFRYFVDQHGRCGLIIANGDSSKIRNVLAAAKCQVVYYGFDSRNDYVISDVMLGQNGSTFSIFKGVRNVTKDLFIKIPGKYNILNFTAAAVLLEELGVPALGIEETAKYFTGVGRRFEISRSESGHIFIDDFAHHPTQVKNLFDGIKQFYPDKQVCAVFQPRQYHLIRSFLKEYGSAFGRADDVVVTDILPCLGDTKDDVKSLSSVDVAKSIEKYSNRPVKTITKFPEIAEYIRSKSTKDSVITTIGAGNIYQVRDLCK